MFELYPAIDIHQGRCVRLTQGDYATANVYDESPANAARRWVAAGATQLHVVDLDGAKAGYPVNLEAIAAITAAVSIPIQLGGGIRTHENVATVRQLGVARVIIGTKAVQSPEFVAELVALDEDDAVPEPVVVTPVPGLAARTAVLDFYYAQLDYHRRHRRWATSLTELNWSATATLPAPPTFTPSTEATGYEFSVPFTDGPHRRSWTIRQDRRLTLD
jgi:uncharacterized protein related to proFAR isomerase